MKLVPILIAFVKFLIQILPLVLLVFLLPPCSLPSTQSSFFRLQPCDFHSEWTTFSLTTKSTYSHNVPTSFDNPGKQKGVGSSIWTIIVFSHCRAIGS